MIQFKFKVTLQYRAAQAFIDEDLDKVHDRLTKRVFDCLADEFTLDGVVVEVEPA